MSDKSITVGVPSGGHPKIDFVNSLVLLTASGLINEVLIIPRLPIHQAREQLARRFTGTHLLMIDDDMVFNVEDIQRLIEADKPIISGLYNRRSTKPAPVVFDIVDNTLQLTDAPKELSKVVGTSLACTLIERSVFSKVGFEFRFGTNLGEDQEFILRCLEADIEWWLDPQAKIGHISEVIL
mgnify:FL=1